MIFVPLPFVVTLILALLAIRLVRAEEGGRHHTLFLALILAYGVQSVLVGLRWGYDLRAVLPLQAMLACLIAPLAYVAFRSLTEDEAKESAGWVWPHLVLPPLAVAVLFAWQPAPIGPLEAASPCATAWLRGLSRVSVGQIRVSGPGPEPGSA